MSARKRFDASRWVFAALFGVVALALSAAGYWEYENEAGAVRRERYSELKVVADLKTGQLVAWRQERISDARMTASAPILRKAVAQALRSSRRDSFDSAALRRLDEIRQTHLYESAIVARADGSVLASAHARAPEIDPGMGELVARAFASRDAAFGHLFRCDPCGKAYLDVAAPVLGPEGEILAALILRIDPETYLYPLIQSWPTPSASAETLLVRREGDSALFLNTLRHRRDPALKVRVPLSRGDVPAVRAALGQVGEFEGLDYRGVRALAYIRAVPDTAWFLVAKVDVAEVLAEARRRAYSITMVVVLATLLAAAAIGLFFIRRRHAALQESESRYRALFEQTAVGLTEVETATGRFKRVNRRYADLLGYTREELAAMDFRQVTHPEDLAADRRNAERLTAGEIRDFTVEKRYIRKDGSLVWVNLTVSPLWAPGEKPSSHITVAEDITQRKAAESEARRLNHGLDLLGAAVRRLAAARDVDAVASEACGAARQILSADAATFSMSEDGQWRCVAEDGAAPVWKGSRFPPGDGLSRWMAAHLQTAAIEDIAGDPRIPAKLRESLAIQSLCMAPVRAAAPVGAIGCYWTDRHAASGDELRLIEALAEAAGVAIDNARLYAELERRVADRTAQLEGANRELEAFSYSVSHDLRTPLRALHGFSAALLSGHREQLDDRGRHFLDRIQNAAERMAQLIEDLLTLSRITRRTLESQTVDLGAMAREIAAELHDREPRRSLEFVIGDGLAAEGDPHLLRIALENLLSNAWKFTSPCDNARVEVGAADGETGRVYFVRDTGVGFDMAYADKLFTPFQRLHGTSDFPGTGIGLAIAQRVVHRHGGRIWAEAAPGKGAAFYFTLERTP